MAAGKCRFASPARPAPFAGLALALLASCGPAAAQQQYGQQQRGTSPGRPSPETAMQSLHEALELSPQQEGAWRAYSAQMASSSQASARRQAAARLMPSLDAPRRMDLIEAELRQELADLHTRALALKSFYALLTPAQRRTFDERTLPPQEDDR